MPLGHIGSVPLWSLSFRPSYIAEAALEVGRVRDCKVQQRGAEVLEHLSHREKRPAAGALVEALFACRYEGTRGLRNRSANGQATRRRCGMVSRRQAR